MRQRTDTGGEFRSGDTADLEDLREALTSSVRHRLILWAIRWILGFAAIALVVYFWPTLTWLFWVGAAVAVTSLVVMLSIQVIALRRIDAGKHRIQEYEKLAREAEEKGNG